MHPRLCGLGHVLLVLFALSFATFAYADPPDDWCKEPPCGPKPKPTATTTTTATTTAPKPTATPTPKPTATTTAPKPTATPSAPPEPSTSAQPEPSSSASATPSASASEEPPPAPSASASGAPLGPFERRKVKLGAGDLQVSLAFPVDWAELPPESLPKVDTSGEGAEQVKELVTKGWGVHAPKVKPPIVREVIIACGKASGEYWADAIRDAAFTQMTAAIEKEAGQYTTLKTIEPEPIRSVEDRFEQSFAAEADFAVDGKSAMAPTGKGKPKVASTVKLQGLSFIGFQGEGTPSIIACSIACAQLVQPDEAPVCASIIGSIQISGDFAPVPKRSWLAEIFFKLKRDPTTMWLTIVGAVFLLLVIVLIIVLAIRKKKPGGAPGAAGEHDDDDDDLEAARAAAAEVRSTMHASPPPTEGYFDPQTLARRKV